jgi:hypothetical protein
MADKKKKQDSAQAGAAEAVSAAVGKTAAPVGAVPKPATPPKHIKIPKLAKSGKSRLPRKQKKLQQKVALAASRQ